MFFDSKLRSVRTAYWLCPLAVALALMIFAPAARAQEPDITKKLDGFDSYMAQVLKDWNTPGIGVGIVVNDKLVFAKGYGYRDYEKKLPFTPATLQQIASNSKLFTAVAAGMLVEEGKLTWDKPIRESVPTIQFYNDQLNNNITLRDMLSHRTGVTRHDLIWFKSAFTRKELFDKLKYLEPQEPMRETFLYNNLMFAAVGEIIELKSGQRWEQFVREKIFTPLDMSSTSYSISNMNQHPDHGVPFRERRDSFELYKIPYYEDTEGVAPAGAIISNTDELSHWLIALMNDGKYNGKQVLPAKVLKETLQPAIGLPNTLGEALGFWELLNPAYGMGRQTVSYRGHLLTFHGGDLPGFHSQVSPTTKSASSSWSSATTAPRSTTSSATTSTSASWAWIRLRGASAASSSASPTKKPAPKRAPKPAPTAWPTLSLLILWPAMLPNMRIPPTAFLKSGSPAINSNSPSTNFSFR